MMEAKYWQALRRTVLRALWMLVAAIVAASPAWSAQDAPAFSGMWTAKTGAGTGGLFTDLSWQDLTDRWKQLRGSQYLVDVAPYRRGNTWRYAALWRVGAGNGALYAASWPKFVAQWKALEKNQELIDLEVLPGPGEPTFLGVWREKQGPDQGNGALFVDMDWDQLVAHWKELSDHQYLADVETYVRDGKRRYAGVWRRGSGNGSLLKTSDWSEFARYKQSRNGEEELIDFNAFQQDDGSWAFLGVWRRSDAVGPLHASRSDERFEPLGASEFVDRWKDLSATHTLARLDTVTPEWPDIEDVRYLGNYPSNRTTAYGQNIQGIASDGKNWFFSQYRRVWKFPLSHDLRANPTDSDPAAGIFETYIPKTLTDVDGTLDHFGDLDHHDGFVFVPLEGECVHQLVVFRASDLSFVASAPLVLANGRKQSMAGWVAIHPRTGLLYSSGNHIDGNNPIYVYRVDYEALRQGRLSLVQQGTYTVRDGQGRTKAIGQYLQGGAFSSDGRTLFLSNGSPQHTREKDSGLWIFDFTTGKLLKHSEQKGKFEFRFSRAAWQEPEGIAFVDLDGRNVPGVPGGQLHAILFDDDGAGKDEFFLKHYRIEYRRK